MKKYIQKQHPRGDLRKRCSENMQQINRRTPMSKYNFNEVSLQLYWNRTLAWVFSCKFTAYYQNTFLQVHLWGAASVHVNYMQNYFQLFSGNCFSKYCIYTGVCVPWPSALGLYLRPSTPRPLGPQPSAFIPSTLAPKYCRTKYNTTI